MNLIIYTLISIVLFTSNAFAYSNFDFDKEFGNFETDTKILDNKPNEFTRQIRAEFEKYIKQDALFRQIVGVSEKAKKAVETCRDMYLKATDGVSLLVANKVCHSSIALAFPGSNYTAQGGYIVLGNYIVYLSDVMTNQVTKIEYRGNYNISAINQHENVYVVYIELNKNSIQFVLTDERIIDILNVSIIYDIERAFLSQNKKISVKQIVSNLLEYYSFLKNKQPSLSSLDFAIDILSNTEAQQKFISFVMSQGGKK